jgi:hypothetical protein
MLNWLEEIFRSKGGRRFSRYSKDIVFNSIANSKAEEDVFEAE